MRILTETEIQLITNSLRKASDSDLESAKILDATKPDQLGGLVTAEGAKHIAEGLREQAKDARILMEVLDDADNIVLMSDEECANSNVKW